MAIIEAARLDTQALVRLISIGPVGSCSILLGPVGSCWVPKIPHLTESKLILFDRWFIINAPNISAQVDERLKGVTLHS